MPGAIGPDDRHFRVDVRFGLVERGPALMEGDEDRAAGEPEAALRVLLTDDARIRRQVPERAELRIPVAGLDDLVEVALPWGLERVATRVPDAP